MTGLSVQMKAKKMQLGHPEAVLTASCPLPHGCGTHHDASICDLLPSITGGKPRWLVLCDVSITSLRDVQHTVLSGLIRHH